jgi:hypothetical protein
MTNEQLSTVEGIVVTLANGVAYFYPPAAPLVTAIRGLIEAAEEHGIIPTELPDGQLAAIAAGMAAARASAITSDRARRKP